MFLLGYASNKDECKRLSMGFREAAAYWEEQFSSNSTLTEKRSDYLAELKSIPQMELCFVSINDRGDIALCTESRKAFCDALMLLIADPKMSPTEYMCPDILAAALLLRPVSVRDAQAAFYKLFGYYSRRMQQNLNEGKFFVIEQKGGKINIPLNSIEYFEARDKKLYLCTKQKQIAFYSTLDSLSESLPKQFVRCHKSYIVNKMLIERIAFSENLIYMSGGIIPISRSYRASIMEICYDK